MSVIFEHAASQWRQMRHAYQDVLEGQYDAAVEATRGHLVNAAGRARGWTSYQLFRAAPHVQAAYATDELRDWLAEHPRLTLTEFERHYLEAVSSS